MKKLACLISLLAGLLALTGCASVPSNQYGNFVQKTDQAVDKKIADDLVKKLVALYPPARTQFDMQHGTPDFFGTYLVESLRSKGYAISEFKQASEQAAAAPAVAGRSLSYIVDQPKSTDFHRVSVLIDRKQSLDRVYQVQDGTVQPASYWIRKE